MFCMKKRRFIVDVRDNKDVALPNRFFLLMKISHLLSTQKVKMVMKKIVLFFCLSPRIHIIRKLSTEEGK